MNTKIIAPSGRKWTEKIWMCYTIPFTKTAWRYTPSVLALVSQRQEELWKVEARLVCVVSSRAVRTI